MSQDFRRAIEEIKLRAPIEDVVREHVPALKKAGALWAACCPFHEEKTGSFKVDPRRGTWHCFGACAEGGDQIAFVERFLGLSFMEALEILAARTGVELPKQSRSGRAERERKDPGYGVLLRAAQAYSSALDNPDGEPARRYLLERGLSRETLEAFGLGWAPGSGQAIHNMAREGGVAFSELERCGLARKTDTGRAYDFFRGRLMIPIRDLEGRTVGFGARRLGDEGGGPKYINTPETPLFKKSQLIYGLDLALADARRNRHLILVEGYTDVMAAHQVGLTRVGAVLGTSTTEQHAGLVRRCGARRVSLVFDGDAAGSKAARRALHGLLHLEIDLQVVRLPPGEDPCDLLLREGAEAFLARVDASPGWFEDACAGLESFSAAALSEEVDELLELIMRVKRPVQRQSLVQSLAASLGMAVDDLRQQWRTSAAGQRRAPRPRAAAAQAQAPGEQGLEGGEQAAPAPQPVDPYNRLMFNEMIGAVLLDSSLVPLVRPHAETCADQDLVRILEVIFELYEDLDAVIDASSVMTALGEHPARKRVASLVEHASRATSPQDLLEGTLESLRRRTHGHREARLRKRFQELESSLIGATPEAAQATRKEQEAVLAELTEHLRHASAQEVPVAGTATAESAPQIA